VYEANTWLWNFGQPQPEPSIASLSVAKSEKICKRSQCRGAAAKSAWKTRARQAPKSAAEALKALNENCTYGRHIPLQINHISDIICYNDFSTVNAELIIFLLFKLQYTNAHDLWNG
jgi:hypothetical protein